MGASDFGEPSREHVDSEGTGGVLGTILRDGLEHAAGIVVAVQGYRSIELREEVSRMTALEARHRSLQRGATSSGVLGEAPQGSGSGKGNAPHEAEPRHIRLTVWDTRRR